jgi:hypothetical protein
MRGNGSCARFAASALQPPTWRSASHARRIKPCLTQPSRTAGATSSERPHTYLPPLTDAAIDAMAEHAWRKSSAASYAVLFHLGGQIAGLPDHHSAEGGRDARHAMLINAARVEGGPAHPRHRLVPPSIPRHGATLQ